jgi:hypothetical protein
MPLAARGLLFCATIALSGCAPSYEQKRYEHYVSDAKAHKSEALKMVQEDKDAEEIAAAQDRAGRDAGGWYVESDVEGAGRDQPWFCPGEYLVSYNKHYHIGVYDPDAPSWQVNVRVHRMKRLATSAQEDAHFRAYKDKEEGDDRMSVCLDGKGPVKLDASAFPSE